MFIKEIYLGNKARSTNRHVYKRQKIPGQKWGPRLPGPTPRFGLENIVFGAIGGASGLQTHGQCYARFVWQCNVQ